LLVWDVCGLHAAIFDRAGPGAGLLGEAFSREGRLGTALPAVLTALTAQGLARPGRAILAARHVQAAVADLPVLPDKPRPPAQMRELIQADLEPALAEFGSLWSMGALLQGRGYLTASERERVGLEESVRRQNRHAQLRYGEIALELGLIERQALDDCLDQQAALQNLEATIVPAWCGRREDRHAVWLVCGVGAKVYAEWREALAAANLRLTAVLPLAWLGSESDPAPQFAEQQRDDGLPRISLELHLEEVVAILRRKERVVAARSEGRGERKLSSDWLHRLMADWASEPRVHIEICCLHAADEAGIDALCDDLGLCTGHACRAMRVAECRQALWRNLMRAGTTRTPGLPRLVERELRGSLWNDHDVRRLAALGGVLLAIAGAESFQQYRLYRLQERMTAGQEQEQERAKTAQQEAQVGQQWTTLAQSLDATRRQLEPLLNDRARLHMVLAMQADLPELLYTLAQAVGDDAVLDEVHNDVSGATGAAVLVRAWSPSYTGAQDFVSRVAALVRARAWGVAQTEIKERTGRDGKPGHEVSFWLLPEESELEPTSGAAALPSGGNPDRPQVSR
jgi:hypothetical protein